MGEKTTPATGLALAIRDEHIAELEAEVAALEAQLAAARQEAQELRTAACTRCAGSAIDPEDSSPGIHHDRGEEPPAPEPCRDCVHPDGAEPVAAHWNKIVTQDEDGTVWVLCTTDPGQPIALRLDEDLAEALAGSLLGTEDGEEVDPTASPARRAAAHTAILNLLAQHHPDADNTTTHGGTGEPRALADDAAAYTDAAINALVGGA